MRGGFASPANDADRGAGRGLHRVQAAIQDCRDVILRPMVLLFPCIPSSTQMPADYETT